MSAGIFSDAKPRLRRDGKSLCCVGSDHVVTDSNITAARSCIIGEVVNRHLRLGVLGFEAFVYLNSA